MDELEMLMLLKRASSGKPLVEYNATGNPVTFETNVAKPLKSLLIPWTPSQSGSGDPSPENVRPITGFDGVTVWQTGKNLFNEQWEQGNIATGVPQPSTTAMCSGFIDVNPSTSYYGYTTRTAYVFVFEYTEDGTYANKVNNISLNHVFTTGSTTKKIRIADRNSGTETVDTGINYPSTETAYSPYVSGSTYPVSFPALGKNLFDKDDPTVKTGVWWKGNVLTGGSYDSYTASGKIPVTPGETYTLIRDSTGQSAVCFFDEHGAYVDQTTDWNNALPTKTIQNGIYFIAFNVVTTDVGSAMLNVGSTALPYEPYTNTCYGGELDLVSGVLTVEWKSAFIKDLTWIYANAGYFYTNVTDHKQPPGSGGLGLLCSAIPYGGTKAASAFEDGCMYDNAYSKSIYVKDTSCADTDALKTKYGNYSIVYPLDEPIVYSLSDLATITTLIGDNILWTDTNGSNSVTYLKKG